MAKLSWKGKQQCANLYNREHLGSPPVRCSRYASPGKAHCKGHETRRVQ